MTEQEPPAFKEMQDILHEAVDMGQITLEEAQERIEAYRNGFLGKTAIKGSADEQAS